MEPRWYQTEAVNACWEHIRTHDGNPCIVLPTGAGKSLVIAMAARDVVAWQGRCLVLAHRKELLEQNAEKIQACMPGLDVGVYSAGLRRKDFYQPVVVAGVQSCFRQASAYNLGHRDIVIVDEAHLIPLAGDGMYRELLEHLRAINPRIRIVGLTATPYRLDHGLVCGPDNLLNSICYEVPLLKLIEEGFLCPLTSKEPEALVKTEGVGTKGGEFIQGQLDKSAANEEVVRAAVAELLVWTMERRSVLIFACGRRHAAMLRDCIARHIPADQVGYVDGETKAKERAEMLERFKAGLVRYLINIDVLTTGFDAPNVDCVALLRPTLSPGLLYQMIGRGFRLHPSKQNCLVLDFGGNIERHGPVDRLKPPKSKASGGGGAPGEAPARACPKCKELVAIQVRECPECGYLWPEPEAKHDARASSLPVLSNGLPTELLIEWVEVNGDPTYLVHRTPGKEHPAFRVIYKLRGTNAVSEFVNLDHPPGSRMRLNAETWWQKRSDLPVPVSCWEAWHILKKCPAAVAKPTRVELRWTPGKKWPDILRMEFAPREEIDLAAIDEAKETAWMQANIFKR
jgi:DNA repair protein RadD